MKYTAPEMEIVKFVTQDVVLASSSEAIVTSKTTEEPVIGGDGPIGGDTD